MEPTGMKYFLFCSMLALVACSMPGVGELEERVGVLEESTGYDDTGLTARMDQLEQQYGALEDLLALPVDYATDSTGHGGDVRPSIDPAQILLLQETLASLTDSLSAIGGDIRLMGDSISVLNENLADLTDSLSVTSETLDEVGIAVDSLTAENVAMLSDIEDLQGELWSIQQAAQDEMGTSGRGSTGSGSRDSGTSGSGSGSRGSGTTGGGSGGGSGR
jgi:hypothetical protein